MSKKQIRDITNIRFDRLVGVKFLYRKNDETYWEVKCDCGSIRIVSLGHLTSKHTTSCGCKRFDTLAIHGGFSSHTNPIKQKFYLSWKNMISRCYNFKDISYPNYGGRGVTVCARWRGNNGFKNYIDDKYQSYIKHIEEFGVKNTSCERIKVNGSYTPENTRWATLSEQGKNRQLSPVTKDLKLWKEVRKVTAAIRAAIIRNSSNSIYEQLLGCSIKEVRLYIEDKFIENMTWKTYGYGNDRWEFDHIKSLRLFDFSTEDAWLDAFHYTNLRPFRRSQNASKC